LISIDPPPFVAEALCAQTDPELFFPEQGESSATARSICKACPARQECLLWAIQNNENHGVWGGYTPRARRRIKQRHRRMTQENHELAS